MHRVAALEQSGHDLVKRADGIGGIRAELLLRSLQTGALAVPEFALGIAVAAEQHELTVGAARHEHGHRFGLAETGQVQQVGVRPIRIIDIAAADLHRARGNDGRAAGTEHAEQGAAPAGEVFCLKHLPILAGRSFWEGRSPAFLEDGTSSLPGDERERTKWALP